MTSEQMDFYLLVKQMLAEQEESFVARMIIMGLISWN